MSAVIVHFTDFKPKMFGISHVGVFFFHVRHFKSKTELAQISPHTRQLWVHSVQIGEINKRH